MPLCLAKDLAFPYGLLVRARRQRLVVAESWRHRLLRLPSGGGAPMPILSKLPGYPARLAPAGDGGAWLTLFAPRNRLIEFVLRGGRLSRRHDARGAARTAGSRRRFPPAPASSSRCNAAGSRPWASTSPGRPSRSYGLVVRLDAAMRPVTSFHSRANGTRHGVTSAVEVGGRVLVASKGGDAILDIGEPLTGGASLSHGTHHRDAEDHQGLSRRAGGARGRFRPAQGRDPCAARRERRRQVDPHQGHGRRRRGDQRAHALSRPAR